MSPSNEVPDICSLDHPKVWIIFVITLFNDKEVENDRICTLIIGYSCSLWDKLSQVHITMLKLTNGRVIIVVKAFNLLWSRTRRVNCRGWSSGRTPRSLWRLLWWPRRRTPRPRASGSSRAWKARKCLSSIEAFWSFLEPQKQRNKNESPTVAFQL